MLTAEQILKADDSSQREKVDVPEWGGHVYVRVLSGAERDRFELIVQDGVANKATANIRASLCVRAICDAEGKRIFTDNQAANLATKSSVALDRVFEVAQRLNKLKDEDIEDLQKN